MRFKLLAATALVVAACNPPAATSHAVTPQTAKTEAGGAPGARASEPFDPVKEGRTADGLRHLCDDHLAKMQGHLDAIKKLKGVPPEQLTYANTLGRFDDAALESQDAQSFTALMSLAHPDKDAREAAKQCEPKVEKLTTAAYLDADLAAVLKAYAKRGEKLEGEKARFLSDTLRDFRRNGLDLPVEKQTTLRALNAEITDLGQKFQANIGASTGKILIDKKSLEGLPPEYVAKHAAPKDSKDGKIEINTDYPDYFPFVTYAKDRAKALELFVAFVNRGGDENVKLLERLLKARNEKAKLLGYATWADYATEVRMAKNAKTVHDFLEEVRTAVKEPAKAEYAELMKEHVALGGKPTDKLPPSDRYYLEDRVRNKKYKFNSQEIANYFEVASVTKGLLDITSKMYGVEYREVPANAWHPDVTAYEVWSPPVKDPAGAKRMIGKFYLDLYPRADKYKHAAMFPIRTGRPLRTPGTPAAASGGDTGPLTDWQLPEAVLECNFSRPGEGPNAAPALMTHEEAETFFHEFGHVLHHMFSKSELASYSGANTERDFVEAPSQMFEEWVWSREVVDLFAHHHKTGAKIPDELFQAMLKARTFGRALATDRQLFLAMLDQTYHTREPGGDSTKIVEEVQASVDPFAFVKGTHFQSSFGHLIEYDAGYYGYQWALAVSRDVLTRFKKEGLMNPRTAASWREEVLSKGGGIDERTMEARFLGREPNNEAYFAFLKGQD